MRAARAGHAAVAGWAAPLQLRLVPPPALPAELDASPLPRPARIERALLSMEGLEARRRRGAKALLLGACLAVGWAWYAHVYCLPKQQYNALHPYTSWIPITGALAALLNVWVGRGRGQHWRSGLRGRRRLA